MTAASHSTRPAAGSARRCRPVAFVYQRMLPYHEDRFAASAARLRDQGFTPHAIQVAEFDSSYGDLGAAASVGRPGITCLFPGTDYLTLSPRAVVRKVVERLDSIRPETVFAPAAAFSEGAACLRYRAASPSRLILMDDAWSATDRRGALRTSVKRLLYQLYDGAFLPSEMHGRYFEKLGIPAVRQRYAVDAVAPETAGAIPGRPGLELPGSFVICVARLLRRKGIEDLLHAFASLRPAGRGWCLVIVGDGPDAPFLKQRAVTLGLQDSVRWLGRLRNADSRSLVGRAQAMVIPSLSDQWGLVVNEGWQAGTPVVGSTGVGAIAAAYDASLRALTFAPGDREQLARCLREVLELDQQARRLLVERGQKCMAPYSLAAHVQSVLELVQLPVKPAPGPFARRLAGLWNGRVIVF